MNWWVSLLCTALLAAPQTYQSWTKEEAEARGKSMRQTGRVGGFFDTRLLRTNESYNYKLAATWLTSDVIKAAVRLRQLALRLTPEEADSLVAGARVAGSTTILVEVDPREGSGVIPLEWVALLEVDGRSVRGTSHPELRDNPAMAGVLRRNYDYEQFWISFPTSLNGQPLVEPSSSKIELVVAIKNKEGRVAWPMSTDLRAEFPPARQEGECVDHAAAAGVIIK